MQIRELTTDECEAILQSTNLGRLACVRYNTPYIVPVYFDYYRDALYSFATVGKKIQWMRTNPRVCVEFDDILDRFNWTTVVVKGRYEELTKSAAHQAARTRAYALFENRPDWWYPAAGKTKSAEIRTPVIYRILIETLSGRRAASHPRKVARAKPVPAGNPGAALVEPRAAPAAGTAARLQVVSVTGPASGSAGGLWSARAAVVARHRARTAVPRQRGHGCREALRVPHHPRDFRRVAQPRQPCQVEKFERSPQRVWRPAVRIGVHLEIHVGAVIGHEHGLVDDAAAFAGSDLLVERFDVIRVQPDAPVGREGVDAERRDRAVDPHAVETEAQPEPAERIGRSGRDRFHDSLSGATHLLLDRERHVPRRISSLRTIVKSPSGVCHPEPPTAAG